MRFQNSVRIGDHEVEIQGGLVRIAVRGDFDEPQIRRYAELIDAAIPRGEPYAAIADVSQMKTLGPAARRFLSTWHKGHHCARCALVGAGVIVRGLMHLALRTMNLLGTHSIDFRFFTTEIEADAWFSDWKPSPKSRE